MRLSQSDLGVYRQNVDIHQHAPQSGKYKVTSFLGRLETLRSKLFYEQPHSVDNSLKKGELISPAITETCTPPILRNKPVQMQIKRKSILNVTFRWKGQHQHDCNESIPVRINGDMVFKMVSESLMAFRKEGLEAFLSVDRGLEQFYCFLQGEHQEEFILFYLHVKVMRHAEGEKLIQLARTCYTRFLKSGSKFELNPAVLIHFRDLIINLPVIQSEVQCTLCTEDEIKELKAAFFGAQNHILTMLTISCLRRFIESPCFTQFLSAVGSSDRMHVRAPNQLEDLVESLVTETPFWLPCYSFPVVKSSYTSPTRGWLETFLGISNALPFPVIIVQSSLDGNNVNHQQINERYFIDSQETGQSDEQVKFPICFTNTCFTDWQQQEDDVFPMTRGSVLNLWATDEEKATRDRVAYSLQRGKECIEVVDTHCKYGKAGQFEHMIFLRPVYLESQCCFYIGMVYRVSGIHSKVLAILDDIVGLLPNRLLL